MNEHKSLTAAGLIAELEKLHPETIVTIDEYDSEWARWYTWSIARVSPTGVLEFGVITNSGWDEDDSAQH